MVNIGSWTCNCRIFFWCTWAHLVAKIGACCQPPLIIHKKYLLGLLLSLDSYKAYFGAHRGVHFSN